MSELVALPSPDPAIQRLYRVGDRKYSVVRLPDMYGYYAPHVWELARLMSNGDVEVVARFETKEGAEKAIQLLEETSQPKEVM